MQNDKELRAILKNATPEIIDTLNEIMRGMIQQQKAHEAEKYESLHLTPSEAAEIVTKDGGSDLLMTGFALDALRYYLSKVPATDSMSRALWSMAFLLEAGRIIGIRQERARRKARRA